MMISHKIKEGKPMTHIARDDAITLLKKYNQDPFHIQHALTVEAVMKWYAKELGYGDDAEYWGIVGLLHDIDFELYPDEHCIKAPELLREGGVGEDIIHAVCSHGYGITVGCGKTIDVEPVHFYGRRNGGSLSWNPAVDNFNIYPAAVTPVEVKACPSY